MSTIYSKSNRGKNSDIKEVLQNKQPQVQFQIRLKLKDITFDEGSSNLLRGNAYCHPTIPKSTPASPLHGILSKKFHGMQPPSLPATGKLAPLAF